MKRWQGTRSWLAIPHLILVLLSPLFRSHGHHLASAGLVGGVVEESPDVVDKKGIEKLSDLLLVREIQCTIKGNPACQ